eukprot:TRINITY_DN6854_c0_g1_i1.p1 TRINITY_DN6854_c0_g1~~TRINITY_DN6854_c0_g1_i1.p1  ORF type:complete len:112 (+),score=23.76 TRINITY_DN6854_c0_g1_i1:25-360(+)
MLPKPTTRESETIFFFSSRRRHTRQESVSWARRCVQETAVILIADLNSRIVEHSHVYTIVMMRSVRGKWCIVNDQVQLLLTISHIETRIYELHIVFVGLQICLVFVIEKVT